MGLERALAWNEFTSLKPFSISNEIGFAMGWKSLQRFCGTEIKARWISGLRSEGDDKRPSERRTLSKADQCHYCNDVDDTVQSHFVNNGEGAKRGARRV